MYTAIDRLSLAFGGNALLSSGLVAAVLVVLAPVASAQTREAGSESLKHTAVSTPGPQPQAPGLSSFDFLRLCRPQWGKAVPYRGRSLRFLSAATPPARDWTFCEGRSLWSERDLSPLWSRAERAPRSGESAAAPPVAEAPPGLEANGPLRELAGKMMLFGQFVGDWELDSLITRPDGSKVAEKGEWHFGWVLDRRAIQDVFILHAPDGRPGAPPSSYGTTVRLYDPRIDAWRVVYASASGGTLRTFVASRVGDEIVMEAKDGGPMYRWIFSEVTPDSFHWRSVGSPDGGKTWSINQEMSVRREHSAGAVSVQRRDPERDRQALIALENQWLKAHDATTLDRILAADFIHPVVTGDFLTKSQHIDWVTKHPPPANIRWRFDRLDVRLYGDVGIANGTVVGTDEHSQETGRGVFTDVFAYRNGRWQAVNAQENPVQKLK